NSNRKRLGGRRNEQCVATRREELSCRRGVRGHERGADSQRLERLVRDHALRLGGRAEDAERAAGVGVFGREELVLYPRDMLDVRWQIAQDVLELSRTDDAE